MSIFEKREHYKPFTFPWAFDRYQTAQKAHWLPEEVPLAEDCIDWNQKLTDNERNLLTQLFRFFTQGDCFHPDTEILTPEGWRLISSIKLTDSVAQVHSDLSIDFIKPTRLISKPFSGDLIRFSADRVSLDTIVTPGHNIHYMWKGAWRKEEAGSVNLYQNKKLAVAGYASGTIRTELTDFERVLIAFQADGNVKKGVDGSKLGYIPHRFTFKKGRKINRFRSILEGAKIPYVEVTGDTGYKGVYTTFTVEMDERLTKDFGWIKLDEISHEWAQEFINEVMEWDGWVDDWGNSYYSNTNEEAANKVQAVGSLAGIRTYIRRDIDDRSEEFSDLYTVGVGKSDRIDCQHIKKELYPFSGDVHCVTVPSGKILVRYNGKVVVSGNCDVASGYHDRYILAFPHPELRMMLGAFATAEANHMHSYSLLLDTVGMPEAEYQAFHEFDEMRAKHEFLFAERVSRNSVKRLALDIAIFSAFGEGMQLFSSFAILMSFQRRNLMKGMATIIEYSIRDESLHVESMIELFHTILQEHPEIWTDGFKAHIYQACRDMVDLEDRFIDLAFEMGDLPGITAKECKTYIRYIADRRLLQLGLKTNYGVTVNPFDWLDWIMNAETHTNFFEGRSTEYSKGGVVNWDNAFTRIDAKSAAVSGGRKQIVVYGKADCPYCHLLKDGLTRLGEEFVYISLDSDTTRRNFYENSLTNSVPQVYLTDEAYSETNPSGEALGGWDRFEETVNRIKDLRS